MLKIDDFKDGDDLASKVVHNLDFHWEDFGIGSYECWGCTGVDVQMGVTCEQGSIDIELSPLVESIPMSGYAEHTHGGCDGEHYGQCRPGCEEVKIRVKIKLTSVELKDDKYIASYEIDCE